MFAGPRPNDKKQFTSIITKCTLSYTAKDSLLARCHFPLSLFVNYNIRDPIIFTKIYPDIPLSNSHKSSNPNFCIFHPKAHKLNYKDNKPLQRNEYHTPENYTSKGLHVFLLFDKFAK